MGLFEIRWKHSATKELKKLSPQDIQRILKAVEELASEPYPHGTRKLTGSDRSFRIRVGDYRVIYSVLEACLVIEIVRVGHRKEVYR